MNGVTRCSGDKRQAERGMCPLRFDCQLFQRYERQWADAIYEIEPPFIGAQCDHFEQVKKKP